MPVVSVLFSIVFFLKNICLFTYFVVVVVFVVLAAPCGMGES